jgi:ubiquinone/menaquinone biosynthesis C-methylase UbiE
MPDTSSGIEADYGSAGLGERIIQVLEDAGVDTNDLTPEILAPADQIHGGGLGATIAHAAMIPFGSDTRVLDIGCGIGGPARYLATTFGCRVTGIDLTADFIDAARLLTDRMGLQDLVDFECADATRLPFDDATFDIVWSQNVTMNIGDREGLYTAIHRVLEPGGIFSMTELGQGPNGAPDYPLPWARDPSYNFLVTPERTRALLEGAGFRITEWRDTTESREAGDRARAAGKPPDPAPDSPLTIEVTRGEDYPARRANSSNGVIEGRLVNILLVAERTG